MVGTCVGYGRDVQWSECDSRAGPALGLSADDRAEDPMRSARLALAAGLLAAVAATEARAQYPRGGWITPPAAFGPAGPRWAAPTYYYYAPAPAPRPRSYYYAPPQHPTGWSWPRGNNGGYPPLYRYGPVVPPPPPMMGG